MVVPSSVVKDGCVRTIQLSDGNNTVDRALTMIPELVEKVSALIKRTSLLLLKASSNGPPSSEHRRNCKNPTCSFFSACSGVRF